VRRARQGRLAARPVRVSATPAVRRGRGPANGAVRIRPARPEEAAAIARVMRAAVRGQRDRYPAALLSAWGSLPALYHRWAMTAGGERYLAAARGARLVGYAAWRGGELTALFVRPDEAGRGLGARLLARLEAEARTGGARRLRMVAALAVVPFYAAHGWRPGRPVRSPLPGGGALPARRMWKLARRGASSGRGAAPGRLGHGGRRVSAPTSARNWPPTPARR